MAGEAAQPKLTVMVAVREGFAHAEASLRSVLADDALPFDLIYLDIASPPAVAQTLKDLCEPRGFPIVRYDAPIAPTLARKAALARVTTPFVVFIDNDVMVTPGCFGQLVACAEETGAGLVGPLYLIAGDGGPARIHMVGGKVHRRGDGAILTEEHVLIDAPVEALEDRARRTVDMIEYHCMLARTDLVRQPDVIADGVRLVHEHIDLALATRKHGLEVWLEPAAQITYLGLGPRRLDELAFFRWRWNEQDGEESLAAFGRRWTVADQDAFYAPVRHYLRDRLAEAAVRRSGPTSGDLDQPMATTELAQTRTALREQAVARGYGPAFVRGLESACDFATLAFDGVYRPDGRPFLNHVMGAASALIRYEMRADVVLAGLLHAVYTHRPDWMSEAEVWRMLSSGGLVDALVRALPDAKRRLAAGEPALAGGLSLSEGLAIAIEAANEADMVLAGEYRACGRQREIAGPAVDLVRAVMTLLDAPGLAATVAVDGGAAAQGPILGFAEMKASFRLDARARRLEPVRIR